MSAANPASVVAVPPYSFPVELYVPVAPFIKSLLHAELGLKKLRRVLN